MYKNLCFSLPKKRRLVCSTHEPYHKQLEAKTNGTSVYAETVADITSRNSERKDTQSHNANNFILLVYLKRLDSRS